MNNEKLDEAIRLKSSIDNLESNIKRLENADKIRDNIQLDNGSFDKSLINFSVFKREVLKDLTNRLEISKLKYENL